MNKSLTLQDLQTELDKRGWGVWYTAGQWSAGPMIKRFGYKTLIDVKQSAPSLGELMEKLNHA